MGSYSNSKSNLISNTASESWLKMFVLAFFTVLGGFTFFAFMFLAIYAQFFIAPTSYKTPIASGMSLYEDMQQIKKEKALDNEDITKITRMRKFVSASRGRMRLNLDHARK